MFISSISKDEAQPIPQARALEQICCFADSLCAAVNFLESFRISNGKSLGSITAAAQTGPAKGPRPASSMPQIKG
jgi:hypothetical protein